MASQFYPNPMLMIVVFLLSSKLVVGDEALIKETCKNTQYSDVCISSLQSDPTSSQADLRGLATIMVNVGIVNASDTYSYLSSQLLSNSVNDGLLKKVLQLCATKYWNANDTLTSTIGDISTENYDYATMRVEAAADYPSVCRDAFKQFRGLRYPVKLKAREDGFKRICVVLLGILSQLNPLNI